MRPLPLARDQRERLFQTPATPLRQISPPCRREGFAKPRRGSGRQPVTHLEKPASADRQPAPSPYRASGRSRRSYPRVSRREPSFSAFVQTTFPMNLACKVEDLLLSV